MFDIAQKFNTLMLQRRTTALMNELRKRKPDPEKCEDLVKEHPEVLLQKDSTGMTPCMQAARRNIFWIVAAAFDAGASAASEDIWGRTVLHYAAEGSNSPLLFRYLQRQGADLDAADASRLTPLHYAAALNAEQAVEALLALGANPKARDCRGETPLQMAKRLQRKPSILALLAKDDAGKAPAAEASAVPFPAPLTAAKTALTTAFRKMNAPGPIKDRAAHAQALSMTTQALLAVDARLRRRRH